MGRWVIGHGPGAVLQGGAAGRAPSAHCLSWRAPSAHRRTARHPRPAGAFGALQLHATALAGAFGALRLTRPHACACMQMPAATFWIAIPMLGSVCSGSWSQLRCPRGGYCIYTRVQVKMNTLQSPGQSEHPPIPRFIPGPLGMAGICVARCTPCELSDHYSRPVSMMAHKVPASLSFLGFTRLLM